MFLISLRVNSKQITATRLRPQQVLSLSFQPICGNLRNLRITCRCYEIAPFDFAQDKPAALTARGNPLEFTGDSVTGAAE
jgi:hypothetical protein